MIIDCSLIIGVTLDLGFSSARAGGSPAYLGARLLSSYRMPHFSAFSGHRTTSKVRRSPQHRNTDPSRYQPYPEASKTSFRSKTTQLTLSSSRNEGQDI